jgi:hypothetical protein
VPGEFGVGGGEGGGTVDGMAAEGADGVEVAAGVAAVGEDGLEGGEECMVVERLRGGARGSKRNRRPAEQSGGVW